MGDNKTKVFNINGNKITPTYNNYWIDVERDLQAGLISNKVSETFGGESSLNRGGLNEGGSKEEFFKHLRKILDYPLIDTFFEAELEKKGFEV